MTTDGPGWSSSDRSWQSKFASEAAWVAGHQLSPSLTLDCLLLVRMHRSQPAVMACSALKPAYRQLLRSAAPETPGNQQDQQQCIAFILLNPPRAELHARLEARAAEGAHFMPASLLDSQLQQLDVPDPQTELYMCFGSVRPSSQDSREAEETGAEPEADGSMPGPQQMVDAILAR